METDADIRLGGIYIQSQAQQHIYLIVTVATGCLWWWPVKETPAGANTTIWLTDWDFDSIFLAFFLVNIRNS